jgi:uncharacterized protein (TIRG00374 family)
MVRRRPFRLQPLITFIAALLLVWLLLKTDLKGILAAAGQIPVGLLLTLAGMQILTQLLLNFQWYRLCQVFGWPVSFLKLLVANSYGAVADAITPGEKVGGELVRLVQIRKFLGYSTGEAAILLAIQKALSLSALVLLNLLVVATMARHVSFLQAWPVRLFFLLLLIAVGAFLFFLLFRTGALSRRLARVKTSRKWFLAFANWVEEFARQTETIRQKRGECLFQLALAVLIWAIFPLKLVLLILPHTGSIPTLVLFGTAFLSYFAGMIPLLPGGLGTFEAAMSGILNAYGLALNQAVAVTVVFRFITFWFVLLLSLLVIGGYRVFLFAQRRGVHASRE